MTRAEEVMLFHSQHPGATAHQCAAALGMGPSHVRGVASEKKLVFRSAWSAPRTPMKMLRIRRKIPYAGWSQGETGW